MKFKQLSWPELSIKNSFYVKLSLLPPNSTYERRHQHFPDFLGRLSFVYNYHSFLRDGQVQTVITHLLELSETSFTVSQTRCYINSLLEKMSGATLLGGTNDFSKGLLFNYPWKRVEVRIAVWRLTVPFLFPTPMSSDSSSFPHLSSVWTPATRATEKLALIFL